MDLSRDRLEAFVKDLCDLIQMNRHGDPIFWEDDSGIPHLHGLSIVQFIETSTIVCHPLPMLESVYLNIFSCKAFDASDASRFCREFWSAQAVKETLVVRT